MPDSITPTALGRLIEPLLTYARHQRLDCQPLLDALSLDTAQLQKPGARFPTCHYARLLEQLTTQSQNPLLALRLGEVTQPRMLGSTGFLMATAATLRDAYQALIDYLPLLYEGAALQLEQTVEGCWLTLELNDRARHPTEYFLACLANWPRALTGHQIPLQRLELSFTAPDDPQAWQRFFAAEVSFDAARNRLLLGHNYLSLSCLDASDEMHLLHREFADSLLSQRAQRSALIAQTRSLIRRQLAQGDGLVRREQVANAVNLSLRTLQRKLGQLGTSFQEIYDQTRREHCLQLIQRGQLSFGEIAFRLGFSNQSAFQKAFKRWMAMAPSQYRDQLRPAIVQLQPAPDSMAPSTQDGTQPAWYLQAAPDQIGQLCQQRLQPLREFCQTLLQWAALCGEQFELQLLAQALRNPLARLAIHIWPAQQQALVEPLDNTTLRQLQAGTGNNPVQFRFCHPLIQQQLITQQPEALRQQRHQQLADVLATPYQQAAGNLHRDTDSTRLTALLHHLNALHSPPETLHPLRQQLNLQQARHYSQQGDWPQAGHHWQQLARDQHSNAQRDSLLAAAAALFNAGKPEPCQQLLIQLEQNPLNSHQQAEHMRLQGTLWQQSQPQRALPLLCQALALLGQPLPDEDSRARAWLLQQLQHIEQQLQQQPLHNLPTLTNPQISAVLTLCEQISQLAWQQAQPLLAACAISRMVTLSLQYGQGPQTPAAFVGYAWVAAWFCADHPRAHSFASEGLMQAEQTQYHNQPVQPANNAWLIQGSLVSHWFQPLTDSQLQLQRVIDHSASHSLGYQLASNLQQHLRWFDGAAHPLSTLSPATAATRVLQQQLCEGQLCEGHAAAADHPQQSHRVQGWRSLALICSALLLDQQQLWPQLYQLEPALEQQLAGSYALPEALFCTAMMRLIQAQPQGQLAARRARQVAQTISRFEHWARFCPDNFAAPLALLQAEQQRAAPGTAQTDRNPALAFERALKLCEQQPMLHHQALCYERYADLLRAQQPRLARFCLQEAQQRYRQWGADHKAKLLAADIARLAQ
ncbi:MAG: AraC family transcriptional regulator ligand-binding domain-containing protein [Marinobacterium sp.]|nr:AraC family transcriptional regulator ligand-binding domain-containing protein [Marinobacterium sp.]